MAVVPRQRKKGLVYYVVNTWKRKPAWENVGTHKRQAEQRDNAMKKEIAAGTYAPLASSKALTLRQYADSWLTKRTNASAPEERRTFRIHVLKRPWLADMRLDAVRHADVDRWIDEMKAEKKADGSRRLTDKTISNAVGVLKQIFGTATRTDLVVKNPCTLEPGKLKTSPAEEREVYSIAETVVLLRHHSIPWPVRMLNALCLLTGMRKGEACGRRWRDLDVSCGPLAALTIRDQYDGLALKTDKPRVAPVHPELAAMLDAWATEGFELWTGRKPEPDDFIVPNMRKGQPTVFTRSTALKAFVEYAKGAGVRPRTMHSTRHTFISLCRRNGARADMLEKVTHNAKGKMIDRYTHIDWAPLCEVVLCLTLDAHQELQRPSGNGAHSWGRSLPSHAEERALQPENAVSGPRLHAPTTNADEAENKPLQKPRQSFRQLTTGDLRAGARARRRKLLDLRVVDPDAARPGLALLAAYEAVLSGNREATVKGLAKAARALRLGERDGIYTTGELAGKVTRHGG